MKGWLIVNNFMKSAKFDELYAFLKRAAEKESIELDIMKTGAFPHSVNALRDLAGNADFALFWDKDVVLARQLEACGLRLFNSADAIEKCDNKAYTAVELEKAGVPVPETYVAPLTFEGVAIDDFGFAEEAAGKIGFPMVVKEAYGSFGRQVSLASDMKDLKKKIRKMGHKAFIMQKFEEASAGRDVRINVVGGRVVCAMLRQSVDGDFRSNVTLGGKGTAYEPDVKQTEAALKACEAIGLDFAGVDLLFGKEGPLVCEVNSNPHFKSTLDATGIDLSEYIMKHIAETLRRQQ